MPKLKTHKGTKRRVKITGTGRVLAFPSGRRHLLTSKPSRRTRRMRKARELAPQDVEKLRRLLPYS